MQFAVSIIDRSFYYRSQVSIIDRNLFIFSKKRCSHLIVQKLGAEVIAIDGKTLKQSYDRNDFQKVLHIVSAWANDKKLVLAQKKVDSKSNEIADATPRRRKTQGKRTKQQQSLL